MKNSRPQDPYTFAESGMLWQAAASQAVTRAQFVDAISMCEASIKDYLQAAKLVPTGRFHQDLRAAYLLAAAGMACDLMTLTKDRSEQSIVLANTAFSLRPNDFMGRIRRVQSFAFARNGFFDHSVKLMEGVGDETGRDAGYHYEKACILSLAGKTDEAMESLRVSWSLGQHNVQTMRTDPDLAPLRRERAKAFNTLVRPRWSCTLDYGNIWNDISFVNESEFSLTDGVLRVTWEDTEGKSKTELLWIESLAPAESRTFESVFDEATKSKQERVKATLYSAENRTAWWDSSFDPSGKYSGMETLMDIDGGNVKETQSVSLVISQIDDRKFGFTMTNGDVINVKANVEVLGDGVIGTTPGSDGTPVIRVYADRKKKILYGWFKTAADTENSEINIFWLTRR